MARNKPKRSMKPVGESQEETERTTADKFSETEGIAHGSSEKKTQSAGGRISPQLSCTIGLEEKEILNELALYASNKRGKVVNTSTLLRALIRLGNKQKEDLEF
ncbi:MAG: hypothetical protein K940chlam2_00961 [Chlamydiae bacterium]|nr:hypothetical protein [Chlamydiota bacterium]